LDLIVCTEIGNAWQVFEWPTSKLGKSNT